MQTHHDEVLKKQAKGKWVSWSGRTKRTLSVMALLVMYIPLLPTVLLPAVVVWGLHLIQDGIEWFAGKLDRAVMKQCNKKGGLVHDYIDKVDDAFDWLVRWTLK